MHFRQMLAYHGPNRSSGVPTLEVWLELGSQHAWRSNTDPRAIERLLTWLPALDDPPQEAPTELGDGLRTESFHKAANRGLTLAAVLEQVARVLLTAVGTPPSYSQCLAGDQPGVFCLTIQFEEEALGRACLETARRCVLAAISDEPFDAAAEICRLVDLADDVRLGPSTRAILNAAAARGIPFRRLTISGSLVQLGEGRLQHRIWTAETDETSSIGEDIAQDKQLTKSLLWSVGVPVPDGRVVYTSEEAWNAAQEIGFPVVVKPQDANHGRGISFDLTNREELNQAFDLALCENRNANKGVIVEQFAFGQAHRLLVVGDRLIAAARGEKDDVVGDGKSTIAELVEEANRDPRRGENFSHPLDPIYLSELTFLELKKQGLTTQSVPEAGRVVTMRVNGDLTTDETSEVHPAVAEKAVLAAQTIGLNIAGLDVIAEDIGRPLEEQGGMIIEVNAGPGLSMHVEPLYGQPQPVGEAIVELMFPGGEDGRIPIVGVSGGPHSAEISQLIATLLRKLRRRVGLSVGPQVTVDGQRPYVMKSSNRDRVHSLLLHPDVEAAVFESDPTEALAVGLGCERCDVAVVSAIDSASASAAISPSADEVLPLVRAVPPEGAAILPSESPHVELWSSACRGHVVLCSLAGETLPMSDHQARGGRVAFFLRDSLVLATGPNAFLLSLKGVDKNSPTPRVHLLPAVAAAWSIGVPVELLRDLLGRTGLNG